MDHIVIDAPSLRSLIIIGKFESLAFRNVRSLESISLHLHSSPEKPITADTVAAVNLLASTSQLQSIEFNGHLCKFFAAGGVKKSTSVTFNYLKELCITDLYLSDIGVFSFLLSMIERCPYLDIRHFSENVAHQVLDLDFNHNYKLDHLRKITIKGIIGSSEELKLVEYLLAISGSLENLFFKAGSLSTDSELKMSRALMRFPRASTKASIICLDT
ncbi:hypothetical protein KSS87_013802 [Heliosperma pusillum]|nr:hypothetical protein KSS87_013802 [Heliosperma pusillum]